jgi:hypothetical protein
LTNPQQASDNWEMGNEHLAAAAYDIVAADYESRFVDELRTKPRDCELLDELAARASGPVLDIGSGPGHIGARVRSTQQCLLGRRLRSSVGGFRIWVVTRPDQTYCRSVRKPKLLG